MLKDLVYGTGYLGRLNKKVGEGYMARVFSGSRRSRSIRLSRVGDHHIPSGFSTLKKVHVDEGYQLCIFGERQGHADHICLDHGSHHKDDNWPIHINNIRLIKDCAHVSHLWDRDCNSTVDTNKVMNSCSVPASKCNDNKLTYCNHHQGTKGSGVGKCLEFCKSNPGKCDQFMQRYCKSKHGRKSKICSCINSPAPYPLCIDRTCADQGYATSEMKSQSCPASVDCNIYHDHKGSMEFIDTELQHKCSPEAFTKGVTHSLNKEDEPHTTSTFKAAPHLMPLKSLQSLPSESAPGAPASATGATGATGASVTVSNKSSTMVSIVKVMIILIVVGVVIYGMVKVFKTWTSLSSLPVLSLLLWPFSIFSRFDLFGSLGQRIGTGWFRLGA